MESGKFKTAIPCSISVDPEHKETDASPVNCEIPATVVVRNASKSYNGKDDVIKGLNLTVLQGAIYSLLGCSGCGKSTTLSCIVGLDKFTSGDVWLFGRKPRSKEIDIPGGNIGFMPQEYSLYNEFTLMETFKYFGKLNGMDDYAIMSAMVFYRNLLQLPEYSKRVGNMSGGERRRVSFAISLQHAPSLIILDEPELKENNLDCWRWCCKMCPFGSKTQTVGVDALLRESIWKHLVDLKQTRKATIIITTHYIEEARRSDTVGIMSEGKLIAEDSPSTLMERFGTSSLEATVLQLVRNQNESTDNIEERLGINQTLPQMASIPSKTSTTSNSLNRICGLVYKNAVVSLRSLTMLIVAISVPALAIAAYSIAIGNNLTSVNFGVVNDELFNVSETCTDFKNVWEETCSLDYFSCKYLKHLSAPTFDLKEFYTKEEAEKAVMQGLIMGFVYFPPEFSLHFYDRAVTALNADPEDFHKSDIIARLDKVSITAQVVSAELHLAYEKFVHSLLADCGYNPARAENPLSYKNPILGEGQVGFRDYLVPSLFIGMVFFWPMVSSGIRYVSEKTNGTMERSIVMGIHMWEIFVAYSVTEFFIGVLRILIIYAITAWIFELTMLGSLWLMFLLGLLSTYMGVAMGFLLASLCTDGLPVALLSMGVLLPNIFLSGMSWPVEGMPMILQRISVVLPCTLPGEAMRSITSRGWGFLHPNVWPGFAVTLGYTVVCFGLSILIAAFKYRK